MNVVCRCSIVARAGAISGSLVGVGVVGHIRFWQLAVGASHWSNQIGCGGLASVSHVLCWDWGVGESQIDQVMPIISAGRGHRTRGHLALGLR